MIAFVPACGELDCPYLGEHTSADHEQMDEIAREEHSCEPR